MLNPPRRPHNHSPDYGDGSFQSVDRPTRDPQKTLNEKTLSEKTLNDRATDTVPPREDPAWEFFLEEAPEACTEAWPEVWTEASAPSPRRQPRTSHQSASHKPASFSSASDRPSLPSSGRALPGECPQKPPKRFSRAFFRSQLFFAQSLSALNLRLNGLRHSLTFPYWQRLFRYLWIRFVRMRESPQAIARGMAAGVFAGSFPLLGMQTVIGVAIATLVRGNKLIAAASTWISNPLTYVPLFALNFQVGRWLLRLPPTLSIPTSTVDMAHWASLGLDAAAALMLGSLVVGLATSIVGYYLGLMIASRVGPGRKEK